MEKILNYIDGNLVDSLSGEAFNSVNPATGENFLHCPDSNKEDADLAVDAASKAFIGWKQTSVADRSSIMLRIADLIEDNLDELAEIESKDNGKPLWLCKKVDIPRAAENFRYFAKAITQYGNQSFDMGGAINYTLRHPLGPVVCISPWNLPLYLFTWKIAPALATGNTVIAKPSEVTPASAFYLSKLCIEAGLPNGVLNICHGFGGKIGQALISHSKVKAVSFTGGTSTGKIIAAECAKRLIPCSLELGGKNPALVFKDCDLNKTVDSLVRSSFTNQGQICLCSSRILIEDSIYDEFKKKFLEEASKLKVGLPELDDSNLGAIVSKDHYEKILTCIDQAKNEGGTLLLGGYACDSEQNKLTSFEKASGYFIVPTIFEDLPNRCNTNQEEIFGPVVTLQKFSSYGEALNIANDSKYGLSATVWTSNINTAHNAARDLDTGIVWVNTWLLRDLRTPFGGVKQSGLGREGGFDALDFFTEPKNVCIEFN